MVPATELLPSVAAWFTLALVLTVFFRYELDMNVIVSALTGVSATAAGLLLAVGIKVLLSVPFTWSAAGFGGLVVFSAVLYELLA